MTSLEEFLVGYVVGTLIVYIIIIFWGELRGWK